MKTIGEIRYAKKYNTGFFGVLLPIQETIQDIQNELVSLQRRAKNSDDFDKIEALRKDINYYFKLGHDKEIYKLILKNKSIAIFLNAEKIFFTRRTRLLRLLNKLIGLYSKGKEYMYMTKFIHLYEIQ